MDAYVRLYICTGVYSFGHIRVCMFILVYVFACIHACAGEGLFNFFFLFNFPLRIPIIGDVINNS